MLLILTLATVVLAQAPGPISPRESGVLPAWAVRRATTLGAPIDCASTEEWKYAIASSEIRIRRHEEILVQGRDRSGVGWRVEASYPGYGGCRFLAHDLDRNGFTDFIVLTANGGSGPAGVTMTVITFDVLGRPVPWQATGPFVLDRDRILNLVDLDGDGKAELLFPYVEEYGLRGEAGLHISLYRIKEGHFIQTKGRFAGREFPIERPAGVRFLDEPDLTNRVEMFGPPGRVAGDYPGQQMKACWLEGISLADGGIVLNPDSPLSRECEGYLEMQDGSRIPSPMILVADLPKEGRIIDILHPSGDLLRRVVNQKMSVAIAGRSCETGCRPFVMWARPR